MILALNGIYSLVRATARNQIIVNKCKIVTVIRTCAIRAIVAKFNFVKEMIEDFF